MVLIGWEQLIMQCLALSKLIHICDDNNFRVCKWVQHSRNTGVVYTLPKNLQSTMRQSHYHVDAYFIPRNVSTWKCLLRYSLYLIHLLHRKIFQLFAPSLCRGRRTIAFPCILRLFCIKFEAQTATAQLTFNAKLVSSPKCITWDTGVIIGTSKDAYLQRE